MPLPHRSRRLLMGLSFLLAQLAGLLGCRAQPVAVVPRTEMVAMSDGVKLATDLFLPPDGNSPYPAILLRTPYGKGVGKGLAGNLCPQGYAVVVQDMRGRFASEGHHAIIFGNDGLGGRHQDGHDTIRWITEQPWSNGK